MTAGYSALENDFRALDLHRHLAGVDVMGFHQALGDVFFQTLVRSLIALGSASILPRPGSTTASAIAAAAAITSPVTSFVAYGGLVRVLTLEWLLLVAAGVAISIGATGEAGAAPTGRTGTVIGGVLALTEQLPVERLRATPEAVLV